MSAAQQNPLIAKLNAGWSLDRDDAQQLLALCWDVRRIANRRDIVREGDRPDRVHLILEGWAARYKLLSDGSRQITAILLPGDFCDLNAGLLDRLDHSIIALTPVRAAFISQTAIDDLLRTRPNLARAFQWSGLVEEATLRAWIVNIGRRHALERIAHLFCELATRLQVIDAVDDGCMPCPLTQEGIGDALGLTSVHVNRVLQDMRAKGLIVLRGGDLIIRDVTAFQLIATYNPAYLHVINAREPGNRVSASAAR